jgi:hypothetical protein
MNAINKLFVYLLRAVKYKNKKKTKNRNSGSSTVNKETVCVEISSSELFSITSWLRKGTQFFWNGLWCICPVTKTVISQRERERERERERRSEELNKQQKQEEEEFNNVPCNV